MKRADTKFVFPIQDLAPVLNALQKHYRILEIEGRRSCRYKTLYFDTAPMSLFLFHQNSKANRYKVRQRKYEESGLTFLEVKFKSNKRVTVKRRIQIDDIGGRFHGESLAFLSTYLVASNLTFVLCYFLGKMNLSLELALALFAVIGMVRCRTETIPIKEMTYLFLAIGLSVINALAYDKVSHAELFFSNIILIAITFTTERVCLAKHECNKLITYENIEMIKPCRHSDLIRDLRDRTGLAIHRLRIGRIDFLRDTVQVRIFYFDRPGSSVVYEEGTGVR